MTNVDAAFAALDAQKRDVLEALNHQPGLTAEEYESLYNKTEAMFAELGRAIMKLRIETRYGARQRP